MGWSAAALLLLLPLGGLVTDAPATPAPAAPPATPPAGLPEAPTVADGAAPVPREVTPGTSADAPAADGCPAGDLFAEPAASRVASGLAAWRAGRPADAQGFVLPQQEWAGESFGPRWRIADGMVAVLGYEDERTHMHAFAHSPAVAGAPVEDIIAFLERFDPEVSRAREGWGVATAWMAPLRGDDAAALCAALEHASEDEPHCEYPPRQTASDWWAASPPHADPSCRTSTPVVRFDVGGRIEERALWHDTDLQQAFCLAVAHAHADALAAGSHVWSPDRMIAC